MFAGNLQREYAETKSAAILKHIDIDGFMERVFGLTNAEERYPWVARWRDGGSPLKETIQALDQFPMLGYCRVVLDNDVRSLECEFMDVNGAVQSATFFLRQQGNGAVRICDFQWGGDAMPKSQITRHSFLLQGIPMASYREDEEIDLTSYSRSDGTAFRSVVSLYGSGSYNDAYEFLIHMPKEVHSTRIWRHYLTCLDAVNQKAAKELRRGIAQGESFDPLVRFRIAIADNDQGAALAALDEINTKRGEPPVYRCIKGSLLLAAGRPAEAAAIAKETMSEQPLTVFAYILGVRAAVAQNSGDAIDILQAWCRITPAPAIDAMLATLPELNELRSSPAYSEWKQRRVEVQDSRS